MHEETEDNVVEFPSKVNRLKNIVRNRKVQLGVTIAITAVVTTVLARSSLFESKFTLDEIDEIVEEIKVKPKTSVKA